MKNILISLLVLCVAVGVASAQVPSQQHRVFTVVNTGTSYADSGIDTTSAIAFLGGYNNVSFVARAADSISVTKVYVDRSPIGRAAASWSVYDSLSTLTDTHNTGSVISGTLRGTAVDKLGGTGWQHRLRISFNSANNGVTSATYGAFIYYNP